MKVAATLDDEYIAIKAQTIKSLRGKSRYIP
jgi:hypothetical protein